MAVLYTPHFIQFFDDNGDPLASGKLYTYAAGTTTPKATYTTAAATIANANPIVLDSAGRAVAFLDGYYKFRLETAASVLVRETDNVSAFTTSAVTIDSILPSQSGNAGKFLTTNGTAASWGSGSSLVLGTPVATTSGTAIDFTGIPAGVKQIIISFDGVSTATNDNFYIQIGDSGGIETSGYKSTGAYTNSSSASGNDSTSAFYFNTGAATNVYSGLMVLSLLDQSTNTWSCFGSISTTGNTILYSSGSKSLSATLDRVRLTTVTAVTFDAGKMNIQYQ